MNCEKKEQIRESVSLEDRFSPHLLRKKYIYLKVILPVQ
jgi:hypothetical protein